MIIIIVSNSFVSCELLVVSGLSFRPEWRNLELSATVEITFSTTLRFARYDDGCGLGFLLFNLNSTHDSRDYNHRG